MRHLELAQLELDDVLAGGEGKDSWEELGVGFYLQGRSHWDQRCSCQVAGMGTGPSHSPHGGPWGGTRGGASHLKEGVDLLAVGGEGHEAGGQVNQAANDQVGVADARLLRGAGKLPPPHHVAVAPLDTGRGEKRGCWGGQPYPLPPKGPPGPGPLPHHPQGAQTPSPLPPKGPRPLPHRPPWDPPGF